MLFKWFDRLRNKSEAEKQRLVFLYAGLLTALIAAVWGTTTYVLFPREDVEVAGSAEAESGTSTLEEFREAVGLFTTELERSAVEVADILESGTSSPQEDVNTKEQTVGATTSASSTP